MLFVVQPPVMPPCSVMPSLTGFTVDILIASMFVSVLALANESAAL